MASHYDILDAMTACGGSFVRQLATLFRLADVHNEAKLKAAFPEYLAEYAEVAELLEQKRQREISARR